LGGSFLKMKRTKEEGNISTNCSKKVKKIRAIAVERPLTSTTNPLSRLTLRLETKIWVKFQLLINIE
jgi:hypothetical protein